MLDAGGHPIPFARITIFGSVGSVVADGEARFSLPSPPSPPFRLTVYGPEGSWLGIAVVEVLEPGLPLDLRLEASERLEVTAVQTGVAPTTMAPPAAAATVLSAEQRDQRSSPRLTDLLEEVPGTMTLGSGHAAVPSLRGLARGRTLVLLDDARVISERRVGPSASFLDPFSLESIEVVRGPGSVVYGSDALGGIIHGRTPVPREGERSLRFDAGGGTGLPMRSAAAEVGFPAGAGAVLLQAHQRSFDDYESPSGEVPDSGGRDRGFLGKWILSGPRSRWALGLQVDQARDVGKPRDDSAGSSTRYPEEDSLRLTANAVLPPPGRLESMEMHLFAGSYTLTTERQGLSGRGLERSDLDAADASFRIVAGAPAGLGSLRFGIDTSSRLGLSVRSLIVPADPNAAVVDEDSVESADRLDTGLFVEGTLPLAGGRLTLAGGARGQSVISRNRGGVTGDERRAATVLTGYAAGTLSLGGSWRATLQAARGFREPTLSDRYYSGVTGRGLITGNPGLEPEVSRQIDLAVRRDGRRLRLALYAFQYVIDNLVERFRVTSTEFAYRNRGEAGIDGAEAEVEWEAGAGISMRIVYGQARGTETEDDQPLDDIPERRARLSVGQAVGERLWWKLGYDLSWRDDRPRPTEAVTPDHATVGVAAGVHLGEGIELRVLTDNLSDRKYPASADDDTVTAPGRSAAIYISGRY